MLCVAMLWVGLLWVVRDREVKYRFGAAARPWANPQPATEFTDHQSADDLQAQAGRSIRVETGGEPYPVVRDGDDQPVVLAHRGDLEQPVVPGGVRETMLQGVLQQLGQDHGERGRDRGRQPAEGTGELRRHPEFSGRYLAR